MTDLLDRLHLALAERYAVVRELGRGGTAVVFLARELRTSRQVALKVLRPEVASVVGTERFLREIRVTSQLQHPHLLTLFDSGEADGCLYYSMPYVAGESLRARLWREGQLPIGDAVGIAAQVAQALAYAHGQGVIHRDVKPENILLQTDPEARALVADFGIAHALTIAGGEQLTATGVAIGTPAYMSPEQASHGRLDRRSDVYGLGCVLYEMLAGSPPFTGPTAQAVLARHAVDPVPSLRTVRPMVSPSLERVVMKALAKVPADRYADAAEFQEALRKSDTAEQTEVVAATRTQRRRVAASYTGLGAVLVLVALGGVWVRGRSASRLHERDWIVVADFDGPADDPGLADAVRELTTAELNQSRFVSTLPRDQLDAVMRLANVPETTHVGPQLARELAYRSSVRAVVAGGVSRMGGNNYSIVMHVVDAADGADILSVAGAASDSNLVTTVQRLARQVREGLGERRSAVEANRPLVQVATPSFAAYRKYRDAVDLNSKGDFAGSNRLLHEALALDPEFASAWALISLNYTNSRQPDSSRIALAEALRHPDRLSDLQHYRTEADAAYSMRHDLPAAVRWYDLYLEQDPRSAIGHNERGAYLFSMGRYEDALADFRQGAALEPFGPPQAQAELFNEVVTLLALGRREEAQGVARDLSGSFADYATLLILTAAAEWRSAESLATTIVASPKTPTWVKGPAITILAGALSARGAVAASDQVLRQAAEDDQEPGARWYLQAHLLLGEASGSPVGLPTQLILRDTTAGGLIVAGIWAAMAGDTTTAQQRLAALQAHPALELRHLGGGPALLRAWIDVRGGRWTEVARVLGPPAAEGERDGGDPDQVSSLATRWLVADAYERAGQLDSAAAYFESVVAPTGLPYSHLALRGLVYSFAHHRLALIYQALHQPRQAHEHWRAFGDAFVTPDRSLTGMVAEGRKAGLGN